MYKVKVNEKFNFKLALNNGEIKVNYKLVEIDQVKVNHDQYHFLHNNKCYNVKIGERDTTAKTVEVFVNGNLYQIEIKDKFDELLTQLGMDSLVAAKVMQIKAPMPGLVLNILKAKGDRINKGENLLVLEAMKMENMIKSPTDGVIQKLEIEIGDKVEKNQVLIKFA